MTDTGKSPTVQDGPTVDKEKYSTLRRRIIPIAIVTILLVLLLGNSRLTGGMVFFVLIAAGVVAVVCFIQDHISFHALLSLGALLFVLWIVCWWPCKVCPSCEGIGKFIVACRNCDGEGKVSLFKWFRQTSSTNRRR